ncbi:MAG: electron transfer flavoprotein subunit beta/FixA family protein [Anaerococcus prevotii]|uniref:electron transfer flavoprotein subunit beta/FixA family protein n=1 Tax=Anaerococcus prevotii TaxID=33034 RepID=UPI0028FEA7A4|nr:electron transfer flavoprotein subunit beta/FixA family protein [Anaerococcus prevotii]MDU2558878.1 electron transfer flavoprotein subunit beta/FixA family protein [Anaerococcus prevotii]
MNIFVCAKQVPDTNEIKIDPITNTLIRKGVPSILNTYDAFALEQALRLKDKDPEVNIVVISMGPGQAEAMLRDCLAVGADKAYLVTDRKFGGSDTLATSYILANAIKAVAEKEGEPDLIYCGLQAIDGDTAQVGPELAEHLGLPQVTRAYTAELNDEGIKVLQEVEGGAQNVQSVLPALITFTKYGDEELRYPKIKNKLKAKKAEIGQITFDDLEATIDKTKIGLKGSPTRVNKSYAPDRTKIAVMFEDMEAEEAATKLMDALVDQKLI